MASLCGRANEKDASRVSVKKGDCDEAENGWGVLVREIAYPAFWVVAWQPTVAIGTGYAGFSRNGDRVLKMVPDSPPILT